MKSPKEFFESISLLKKPQKKEKTIGICLAGGGALGYAHIGVLQALDDNGIHPDIISGSSMGSIIGFVYAMGLTPFEILRLIKTEKMYNIINLVKMPMMFWNKSGISNHQPLMKVMRSICPEDDFSALKKELFVCVSNLNTGEWEIKSSGENLAEWIAASSTIPGIYTPIKQNNQLYVDGGLLNNLPVEPLLDKCDVIIGSDVFPPDVVQKNLKMKNAFVTSIRTVQIQNSRANREKCDFLFEPKVLEKYNEFSFEYYKEIFEIGYRTAIKYIKENPQIKELGD